MFAPGRTDAVFNVFQIKDLSQVRMTDLKAPHIHTVKTSAFTEMLTLMMIKCIRTPALG